MPLGIYLLKNGQAVRGQAVGLVRLTLTQCNKCRSPGVFTNPLRIAHLVDECLSLVQPLADGRRITLRKPERESRLYEGRADHELVTCSAKEQECLLEEGLPPCYTRRVS